MPPGLQATLEVLGSKVRRSPAVAFSPLLVISMFRCWILSWLGMTWLLAPVALGKRALHTAGAQRFRLNLASEAWRGKAYGFIYSISLESAVRFSSA